MTRDEAGKVQRCLGLNAAAAAPRAPPAHLPPNRGATSTSPPSSPRSCFCCPAAPPALRSRIPSTPARRRRCSSSTASTCCGRWRWRLQRTQLRRSPGSLRRPASGCSPCSRRRQRERSARGAQAHAPRLGGGGHTDMAASGQLSTCPRHVVAACCAHETCRQSKNTSVWRAGGHARWTNVCWMVLQRASGRWARTQRAWARRRPGLAHHYRRAHGRTQPASQLWHASQ